MDPIFAPTFAPVHYCADTPPLLWMARFQYEMEGSYGPISFMVLFLHMKTLSTRGGDFSILQPGIDRGRGPWFPAGGVAGRRMVAFGRAADGGL
jgi:hypothetical protein